MQKLLSKLRKAASDYNLIEDGDKIAVGLSGGKDSISLLKLLKAYQRFSPQKFELIAITLDPGSGMDFKAMIDLCKDIQVPYYLFETNIQNIVFNIKKEKNPCSLCANLRRGALNDNAKKLGCNKLALGHHKNDAVETLLLSLFYEGRINSFLPKTYLSRSDLTVIRPMVYINENEIKSLSERYSFPIINNPCPADGQTKREDIKNLINNLCSTIPKIEDNLLNALKNTDQLNVWHKEKEDES